MAIKTFSNFLTTEESKDGTDPELHARLVRANGADFRTLNKLKTFVRERYPDHYGDWREDTSDRSCGKEAVRVLWSKFLVWKEVGESP